MTVAIDAKLLVRYLSGDHEARAVAAFGVIESDDMLFMLNVLWCEIACVLRSAHRYSSTEIAGSIETMAAADNVIADRLAVEPGLAMRRAGGDCANGVIQYAECTRDGAFARRSDLAKVRLLRV